MPTTAGKTAARHDIAADSNPSLTAARRDWHRLQAALTPEMRDWLAGLVNASSDELARDFYDVLMADPEAAPLLSNEIVQTRLRSSLAGWIRSLFPAGPAPDFENMAIVQTKVGEIHARVRVPLHLVSRGARLIKAGIAGRIAGSRVGRDELVRLLLHVETVIDIAIELMGTVFVSGLAHQSRDEEAYRLFFLSQDLSLERESQRASLLEWNQAVLLALAGGSGSAEPLPRIGRSDFGLWFHHRGGIMFEGTPVLDRVNGLMQQLDEGILPDTDAARAAGNGFGPALGSIQNAVNEIRFILNDAFQALIGAEAGRDALTRTLNRRFLPAILKREITLAIRRDQPFAVIMVDLDHFKAINDSHGHSAGDAALRQAAETILGTCRSSDLVFRYGGEEFLVVAVEAGEAAARALAERLREAIARTEVVLSGDTRIRLGASVGVAVFDGHPDYNHLVEAADGAMYQAKRAGRNRVVVAAGSR